MRFHFFLILQSQILVLARKRGVRQPRRTHHTGSNQIKVHRVPFQGQTIISENSANVGDEKKNLIANVQSLKTERERGARKATGKKRNMSRGSSAKSPSTIEPLQEIKIPERRLSKLCKVSIEGQFGTKRGDEHVVGYVYQLEVEPDTRFQQVENEILPSVESATVNSMIPSMFVPLCGSSRKLQLELVQPPESRYLGINTTPKDEILEDAGCGRAFLQPCYVVNGYITAYSVGKSVAEVQKELSTFLENALSLGNFAGTVPGVAGVAFRSMEPIPFTTYPTPQQILELEIPPKSPVFSSPIFSKPPAPSQASNPTPILPTSLLLPTPLQPSILPPPPSREPSINLPTLPPTMTPTPPPTGENTQTEVAEETTSGNGTIGGLSAWWRWLLLCLIILIMVAAIFFVYRGCPGKSKKQHASFEEEDEDY